MQRRIAHCLAQHAAEAPFLSSIEVAELAGVSQPSVTRFAMALGYTGYPDLRRRFRELDVRAGRGGVTRGSLAASEFVEPLPATADPRRPSGDDTRRPPSRDVRPEAHLPRSTSAAPETPAGQDASVHPVPPVGTEMSADPASAADKETSAYAVSSVGGEVCAGPVTSADRETSVSQEASLRSVPPFDGEVSAHPVPSADGETSGGSVPYMGSDSGAAPRPGVATRRGVARGRGLGEEYRRAVLAEIENLRALARALEDPEPVAAAARVLAASRPLPVLGLRAAAAQAAGFAYFAAKVHPDVRLLQEAGSLLADRVEQAAAAGATALLCFALPRYPAELVDALRAARTAGLSVVTVADRRVPPIAGLSDVLLTAAVGTHLVFDTACAPMLLGQVLLEAMCDELPGAQARLEAFETSAAARGVFLID
nr:hypothetical protein [Microbispora rosea]